VERVLPLRLGHAGTPRVDGRDTMDVVGEQKPYVVTSVEDYSCD
jgi:hypothetical protein